ncbi:MAG: helix-turn-helix domain-containing protein [bacterium]
MHNIHDRTQDLIMKAKSGNREALNALLIRYQERILRIVRLRLNPKLRQWLQSVDILQEALISASRG